MRRLEWDQNKCLLYRIAGYPLLRGFEVYGSTIWTFRIVQVSAVEGCPLSEVPLYMIRLPCWNKN